MEESKLPVKAKSDETNVSQILFSCSLKQSDTTHKTMIHCYGFLFTTIFCTVVVSAVT